MSEKNPIRVFAVHLFQADIDYQRLFEYLESRDNFFYLNTSNPDNMPETGGQDAIKEELRKQMETAEIVVLPVSVYDRNPDLVRFQMDCAQAAKKPLLAIRSFGGTVVIHKEVLNRVDDLVEWNDRVIIDTIRRLARNEDTARWEVLEFDPDA